MRKIINKPFCLASIMTVVSLIIQSKISIYCSGIDGYLIAMVSNGCYGENNYCMFIHPLISYLCGKLSIVLPYADCYSLIIMSFMSFSLFCSYYLIFSRVKALYKRMILVLTVICYVFSTCNGLAMRFTLQAGFCMFVGLLLLSIAFHDENKNYVIPGVLCCAFGCMIRDQAAFTLIPFCGLLLLYELIANRIMLKVFLRKCFKYLGVALVCILTLFITGKWFYNQPEYSESTKYNAARSALVDYPVKKWEDIEEKAIGYSENDYYAVTHYIWEDSDIIDWTYLEEISNLANNSFFTQVREMDTLQSKITFTVKNIIFNFSVNAMKIAWFEIGLVVLLFSIYLFLKHKDLWVRLVLVFNLMGYFTIIIFFALLGREVALKELLLSGNLLVLFYLIFILNEEKEKWLSRKWNIVKVVVIAYITFQPFMANKWFTPILESLKIASDYNLIDGDKVETIEKGVYGVQRGIPFQDSNHNSIIDLFSARMDSETSFLLESLGGNEELYIWNIWNYDDELSKLQRNNKLPSKDLLSHNVAIGEWVSGQVYFIEHLESIGAPNLIKALLYRKDTYYVGKDEEIVYQWLKEHYSDDVKIEHVKDVGEYPVWCYYR